MSSKSYHGLAVVTVHHSNETLTNELLHCFQLQNSKNFKVFVVDIADQPTNFSEMPFLSVIRAENKGYAHGLNTGVKLALDHGFSRFVCLNNDTLIQKNFVHQCLESINSHPCSLIGGKIYYAKGFEFYKNRYEKDQLGNVLWYAGGLMDWKNALTIHRGVDQVDFGQYDEFEDTEFITGCLMCFDKRFVDKVGYLDEAYFMYFEDADYCMRASRAGAELFYDPDIVLYHKNSQSTGGSGSELHNKYLKKNKFKFGMKYAPIRTKMHLVKNALLGKL